MFDGNLLALFLMDVLGASLAGLAGIIVVFSALLLIVIRSSAITNKL